MVPVWYDGATAMACDANAIARQLSRAENLITDDNIEFLAKGPFVYLCEKLPTAGAQDPKLRF